MAAIKARLEENGVASFVRIHEAGQAALCYQADWARETPVPMVWNRLCPISQSLDVMTVIYHNVMNHQPFFSAKTALHNYRDSERGTCVLVGSGPSAAGIEARLAPIRDQIKVCTLNLGATAFFTRPPDFHFTGERHACKSWVEHIDPAQTTLLATGHCQAFYAHKWKGENVRYSWIFEMGSAQDYPDLGMLSTAECTAVPALHALALLGFERVILVGFDFSFPLPEEGLEPLMYFDGTRVSESYLANSRPIEAVGVLGEPILLTNEQLIPMQAMRTCCEIAEDYGCHVINASGGTLDHNPMTLGEALDPLLSEVICGAQR